MRNISLRYLILILLSVLIVTPITTHYYLSTLVGDTGSKEVIQNEIDIEEKYKLDQEITGSRVVNLRV